MRNRHLPLLMESMPASLFRSTPNIPHPHRVNLSATNDRLENVSQRSREVRSRIGVDGSGTVGFAPRKKVSRKEKEYDSRSQKVISVDYLDVDNATGEYKETHTRVVQKFQGEASPLPCQRFQRVAVSPRIARGLTLRGKRIIKEGCLLLERRYGLKNLGFYTLTLPFSTREETEKFNLVAGKCLKRFFEKMKRLYARRNERFVYVGVWELHPRRTARCGYPVLHVHYIAPCYRKDAKGFVATPSRIRALWTACLRACTGIRTIRDARVGAEVVRKSSGGYLAKYFVKGVSPDCHPGDIDNGLRLSSFYTVCRSLGNCIRASTSSLGELIACNPRWDEVRGILDTIATRYGLITKDIGGRDVPLGYWFDCQDWLLPLLLEKADIAISVWLK